jgi:peptidyl-prolyl cis-trans isomerase C
VSESVETALGYHLITVLEAPRTIKQPIETVAAQIRHKLKAGAKAKEMARLLASVKVTINSK